MAQIFYESYYGIVPLFGDHVEHSGTKGMRWGLRRYQYYDGSLTPEGREHYGVGEARNRARTDKGRSETRNQEKYRKAKERYDEFVGKRKEINDRVNRKLASGSELDEDEKRFKAYRDAERETLRSAEKRRDKLTTGEKIDRFKKDLEEGKRSAIRDKLDKKEAKAAEKAAKAAAKEALRKAKEDKKIQDIVRRADPKEVQKYLTKLNTKQLEEIKQRMDLKKGISELKSQSLEERKKQAAAEVEITNSRLEEKRAKREAIGEGIAGVITTGQKVADEILGTWRKTKGEALDAKINVQNKLKSLSEATEGRESAEHTNKINKEIRSDEIKQRKEEREGKVTNEARALAKEARSLTVEYAKKLAKEYGEQTLERIRKDPNLASNPERAFNELRSGIHRRMSGKGVPKDSYEEPERPSSSNDNNKGKGTQQQQPKQNNSGNGNQQQQKSGDWKEEIRKELQKPKETSQPSSSNSSNQPKADSGGTATRTVSGLLDKFRKIRKK